MGERTEYLGESRSFGASENCLTKCRWKVSSCGNEVSLAPACLFPSRGFTLRRRLRLRNAGPTLLGKRFEVSEASADDEPQLSRQGCLPHLPAGGDGLCPARLDPGGFGTPSREVLRPPGQGHGSPRRQLFQTALHFGELPTDGVDFRGGG